MAAITHPVVAALDHPLFACGGKRELKNFQPSLPLAGERVDQRSVVGVSKQRDFKQHNG